MPEVKKEVLVHRKDISEKVQELGEKISEDYKNIMAPGESLVIISLLKGALPFTADLMRAIQVPVRLELLVASSYGDGTQSTRQVHVRYQSFEELEGNHILIVDDITDSGHTMKAIGSLIESYRPKDLKLCSFLNKPSRREVDLEIDYIGFDIPDEFVVGYGLDFAGNYRELPDICVIREGV